MSETINKRIRRLRKAKGYTQADVAKLLNLKISTYSQMERKGNINSDKITKLSEVLDTKPLVLLYGEDYCEHPKEKTAELIEEKESKIDIPEIPFIVTSNLYEKMTVIAMRRLSPQDNKEIYNFVLDKLKKL